MTPMLASQLLDPLTLRLPCYVSDKEDGIRCLLMESFRTSKRIAYSRKFKAIPNLYIRNTLQDSGLPLGMDGELVVSNNFQRTASAVMSIDGAPDFSYYVFDYFGAGNNIPFSERFAKLQAICDSFAHYTWLKLLPHTLVNSLTELDAAETDALARGKEGLMLRAPAGLYKFGRSTLKQQWLLKLKRFADSDAKVVGFTELMHNENEQTLDNCGLAERSSHQDSMLPGNKLGALIVRDCKTNIEFKIGTGFTDKHRRLIWSSRDLWLGKIVTYKYQNHGIKVAPRAPVFLRERLDAAL